MTTAARDTAATTPDTPAAVAVVRGLSKVYGDVVAVRDVTFEVRPGEAVGLLGPNGAGKTTSVKALVGLVSPSGGAVELFGRPPTDPRARAELGYLPELFRFPDWLTGREVLELHARLAGVAPQEAPLRIDEVLERVGLAGRGQERVRGYSKGMSQRLGVGQAILARPALVVLDEPTSALDPLGRRMVREVIAELTRDGTAVLLNSHLLAEVESVCHRVVVLDRGAVRWSGRLDELAPAGAVLRVRVDVVDPTLASTLSRFGPVRVLGPDLLAVHVPHADDASEIAEVIVGAGRRLLELTAPRRTLEEAYVQMITDSDQ